MVVMLLPLKQGLKQADITPARRFFRRCYATSIKTRIETLGRTTDRHRERKVVMLLPLKQGLKPGEIQREMSGRIRCYATSIKTRIETLPQTRAR